MQNPILKFRQSSCISEKPGYLSEKLKTLMSSNYHRVQYFLLKLRTRFLLTNVYKRVCGIFLILFRSWVVDKPGFCKFVETRYFLILANNSSSKQNKKSPTQVFQFFRQSNWFLEWDGILHYLSSTPNYKESQSAKSKFVLTTRATLNLQDFSSNSWHKHLAQTLWTFA